MKVIASGRSSVAATLASPNAGSSVVGHFLHIPRQRPNAGFELAGEPHDVDQRRAQIVRHDIGEALDLLVRPPQFRCPLAHPLFERGVGLFDLGARPRQLARIGERRPHRAAHHRKDHERADHRHPAQRAAGKALAVDAVADPRIRRDDQRFEQRAHLVHGFLAGIGPHDRQRLVALPVARQRHRLRQFRQLVGRRRLDRRQHALIGLAIGGQRHRQRLDQLGHLGRRPLIGGEIALFPGQQIAALPGFRVLQRAAQPHRRRAFRARLRRLLEDHLVLLDQPDRRADNADQRHQPDRQQQHGRAHKGSCRNRHRQNSPKSRLSWPKGAVPAIRNHMRRAECPASVKERLGKSGGGFWACGGNVCQAVRLAARGDERCASGSDVCSATLDFAKTLTELAHFQLQRQDLTISDLVGGGVHCFLERGNPVQHPSQPAGPRTL